MPRLSVVIAAYQAEREIAVLLESLCRSDLKEFDVCLCDDGSTDRTARVAASFAGRLDLRLVRNPGNRGVTYSRNQARRLTDAPLLLFLDADVRVHDDTVGTLLRRMQESGADVVCGAYSPDPLDPGPFSTWYAELVHFSYLQAGAGPYNVFNGNCALVKAPAYDALGGHEIVPKGVEVENETMGRRLVAHGFRVWLEPEALVDHHWGGFRKRLFIFTQRIYWWVKVFAADGFRFETALTTPGYGLGTACAPAAVAAAAATSAFEELAVLGAAGALAGFATAYGPYLLWLQGRRGSGAAAWAAALCFGFAFVITASAAWSLLEEGLRTAAFWGRTLKRERVS